jgi:IS5 family transposase
VDVFIMTDHANNDVCVYSLHEPDVYVIAKGKDHKQYEYGNKVSIVSTKDTNIIVGVASHRSAFDKSQTTDIVAVCVAIL